MEASPYDRIYGACPSEDFDWLQRDETRKSEQHREGLPIGLHERFLEMLATRVESDSTSLKFGGALGLNYLGIALRILRKEIHSELPPASLLGLVAGDGQLGSNKEHVRYRERLASYLDVSTGEFAACSANMTAGLVQ